MAINATFYKNTSDRRYLDKTLTEAVSKDCQITEDCDLLNPTLEVNVFSGLSSKNYMYICVYNSGVYDRKYTKYKLETKSVFYQ